MDRRRVLGLLTGLSVAWVARAGGAGLAFTGGAVSRIPANCGRRLQSFQSGLNACPSRGRIVGRGRTLCMGFGLDKSTEHDVAADQARMIYSGNEDLLAPSSFQKLQMDFIMVRSYLKLENRFNHPASREKSLLVAVVEMGRLDLVKALLKMGAGINDRDLTGRTALMVACSSHKSSDSVVDLLLQSGADVQARDWNGDTALNYAQRAGKHAVIQKLRRSTAELHHLYSTPHFKAFLWLNGADMLSSPQPQVLERARSNIALCKMNIEMISINAALRLDESLATTGQL